MSNEMQKCALNEKIFEDSAVGPYLHDEGWKYMHDNNVRIYKSLDTIPLKKFPPIATRATMGDSKGIVIVPREDWNSILIPFHPSALAEEHFNGLPISTILTSLIYDPLRTKKTICSAKPGYFFYAEMEDFRFDIIPNIGLINGNVAFAQFDETLSYCFGFDFDFEYSFFSSANLEQDDKRLNGTFAEWDDYFIKNFGYDLPANTLHEEAFETILRPSIARPMGEYSRHKKINEK